MMRCSPTLASPCHSQLTHGSPAQTVPSPARHLAPLGVEAVQQGGLPVACGDVDVGFGAGRRETE